MKKRTSELQGWLISFGIISLLLGVVVLWWLVPVTMPIALVLLVILGGAYMIKRDLFGDKWWME